MNTPLRRKPGTIPNLKSNPAAGAIEDALEHYEISASQAAKAMNIPRSRLCDIFAGRKRVSIDTALRVEAYLGIRAGLLVALQADYDLSQVAHGQGKRVAAEVKPYHKAS